MKAKLINKTEIIFTYMLDDFATVVVKPGQVLKGSWKDPDFRVVFEALLEHNKKEI